MKRLDLENDRGSLLTFGIGIAILVLMLVTVSVNIATLWTTKVTLSSVADGAALSGAQGIDINSIYQHGAHSPVVLSDSAVRFRVKKYLRLGQVKSQLSDLKLDSVTIRRDTVAVLLSCKPDIPFGYFLPAMPRRVKAIASAKQQIGR
jgi:hypothetical protein